MLLLDFWISFTLGLATPLLAVCVIPLYPGFLAYLSNRVSPTAGKSTYILLGSIIVSGVVVFMLLLGILFTTIFQASLTNVIGIVSPIAFGILAIIGLFLMFNFDLGKFLPKLRNPTSKNPLKEAFLFGFFFGAIVVPCNPAFIAALFARSLLIASPVSNVLNFIFFGIGIGFPLMLFSVISSKWSSSIISFLTTHKRKINFIAGITMLGISLYYLIFVFRIFG